MRSLVPWHIAASVADGHRTGSEPGSVLVVDIEGSTGLAARLRPHGTAGAEALADVLAAVFTPMVDHVAACGGFVAEFAGDGIAAVFLGDPADTVPRAWAAAAQLTETLSSLGPFAVPDGDAEITVRAVIGAGDVEWLVWSRPDGSAEQNAAFTYVGSAYEEAQRGEAITPGGSIAIGPAAIPHLPDGPVPTETTNGFVVASKGTDVRGFDPPSPESVFERSPATRFFPAIVTDATHRGEFRDVVSVFIEFDHLPDPQRAASEMTALLEHLASHRGYLCDVIRPAPSSRGVRALILWGAPTSHEHDVDYALRFAAEVRSAAGRHRVRAGVARDTVFAGFIGTRRQESYTAIGSGVNLAARMCAAAEWGEIRVDSRITARLAPGWQIEDLGSIAYRGFAEPTDTFAVVGAAPVRRPDPTAGTIVGRSRELAALERALAPLGEGTSSGIVAVHGEAGAGKSRLIAELHTRLAAVDPGPVWLTAQADEIRSAPFATLRDALEGYFGGSGGRSEQLAAYLSSLKSAAPDYEAELDRSHRTFRDLLDLESGSDAELDPRTRFENVVLAVQGLIGALAQSQPVIVSIADAQWLDPSTAQVLDRLRRDLVDTPVAIVIETRGADTALEPDHRVELSPLDRDAVEELTVAALTDTPAADLVDLLVERSGGNAFFVQQLLEYLDRESRLRPGPTGVTADVTDHPLPQDMQRLLVARLDELAAPVRKTVQTASVLGREFDRRTLGAMIGDQATVDEHIERAIVAGIWESEGPFTIGFEQSLLRDAAYAMQLHADVVGLHAAAAGAIEKLFGMGATVAAQLAYHLDTAGDRSSAVPHYLVAGRDAADRYANEEALAALRRLLEIAEPSDVDDQFEALISINGVCGVLGDRDGQGAALASLDQLVDAQPDRALTVARLRAELLTAVGEYPEAQRLVGSALADSNAPPNAQVRGPLVFLLAQISRHQGRNDEAVDRAHEAAQIFQASDDSSRVASVDDFLGGIAWELGDFEEAEQRHRRAVDSFRRTGHVVGEIRALNNLGSVLFATGDYSAARHIHEAGAERSRAIGYRMGEGDHLDNVGGTAWAVGDFELAIAHYTAALEIRELTGDAWGMAISKGNLGTTYRAKGDPERARTLCEEALAIDRKIGRRRGEAYDLHGLGLCHLDLGEFDRAVDLLDAAAAIRTELRERHLANESLVAAATARWRRGDVHAAATMIEGVLAEEAVDLFSGAVETTATLLRCIAVLESVDPDEAERLRATTVSLVAQRAARISDPEHRASYLAEVASHRVVSSDTSEAPPDSRRTDS